MIGVGRMTLPCPHCQTPLAITIVGEERSTNAVGVTAIGISVDREKLDMEIDRHVAEHHATG